jgi:hypothetical protein
MTEADVQRRILKSLNKHGWFYNTNDRYRAGVPDILGCFAGRFVAVEVKINKSKLTKFQEFEAGQIKQHGEYFVVCYNDPYYVADGFRTDKLSELITWILHE